jgi:hypothetical protein
MRKLVAEILFAGEVLEIGVLNPALAHPLVGEVEGVLEDVQPHTMKRTGTPGRPRSA